MYPTLFLLPGSCEVGKFRAIKSSRSIKVGTRVGRVPQVGRCALSEYQGIAQKYALCAVVGSVWLSCGDRDGDVLLNAKYSQEQLLM